jgi:hypothetical protein
MSEHSIKLGHHIQLHDTTILSIKPRYMDHIIREAIEIGLHPSDMDWEEGFCLSKSWKPLIYSLKDCKKSPSHGSKSGFSTGLCTLPISGHKVCSLWALTKLHPDVRLPSATSAPSSLTHSWS